jgi:hypothetical protein
MRRSSESRIDVAQDLHMGRIGRTVVNKTDLKGGLVPLLQKACVQMTRDAEFGQILGLLRMMPVFSISAVLQAEMGQEDHRSPIGSFSGAGFAPHDPSRLISGAGDVSSTVQQNVATVEQCISLSRSIQPIMVRSFCDGPMVGATFTKVDYEYVGTEPVQEQGFHRARTLLYGWERHARPPDADLETDSWGYYILFSAACPAKAGAGPVLYTQELVEIDCDAVYLGKLRRHDRSGIRITDQEERREEISRRRSSLERQLRAVLEIELEREYRGAATEALLGALQQSARDKVENHPYDKVWAELLFSDLINILGNQWSLFLERYPAKRDKELLMRHLQHVNRLRRVDAHANDISTPDWHYILYCFDWLDEFAADVSSSWET